MSIDLQNLNQQLRELQPPSARDRLIFEAVVVKGRGQGEVASEQGISQPRVSQIVAEVGEWLDRALPRARQQESSAGELAVGQYVAEAQINFLLEQTMQFIAESKQDRVTEKAGMRGEERWLETKIQIRPLVPVGLLNMALRLSQAKAKLAGVDVSGKTQREAVLAEIRGQREVVRGRESGVRGKGEAKVEKPLITKIQKSAAAAENVSLQVEAVQEDKLLRERDEFVKNRACKQLINHLRRDPDCAGWTEEQFQKHAQFLWDLEAQEKSTAARELGTPPESGPLLSIHIPQEMLPAAAGKTQKRQESRRKGKERSSAEERRREFLAPLAVG